MTASTKAELTRQRLLTAALELFVSQGYDATPVAQIAGAAGVSEMTFYRYFPAKENLLLDDPYDPMIAAAVARQASDLPPLLRTVRGIRNAWHALPPPDTDEVRIRVRIVAQSPALRSSMLRNSAETERVIAEALGGDVFPARIVAAAAMAALSTALLEWSVVDDAELGPMIDAALDVLAVDHG